MTDTSKQRDARLDLPTWTLGEAFGAVFSLLARKPAELVLAIGFIPALWTLPTIILDERLLPRDAPVFGPGRPFVATVLALVSYLWTSIWYAGQLSAPIDVARAGRVHFRKFLTGVRHAPILFCVALVSSFPLELPSLLPADPDGLFAHAAIAIAVGASVLLMVRTFFWAPLIVDARLRPFQAFATSWRATSNCAGKILALGLLFSGLVLPVFIAEALLSATYFIASMTLLGLLLQLALGVLYVRLEPSKHDGAPTPRADA